MNNNKRYIYITKIYCSKWEKQRLKDKISKFLEREYNNNNKKGECR